MKVTWYSIILIILSGLHAIVSENSVTITVEPKDGIICPHDTVFINCSTMDTGPTLMLRVFMDGAYVKDIESVSKSDDGKTSLFVYPNATDEVTFLCFSTIDINMYSSKVIHVTYKAIPAVSDLSVCKDIDSNEFIMSWTPPTSSDSDYYRLSINDHSEEIYQNDSLSLNLTSMVPDNQITVGISPVLGECESLSNYTYLNFTLADVPPCTGESSGDPVMESSVSEGHSSTLSTPVTQTNQHTHQPSSSSAIATASSDITSSSTQHSQQMFPSTTPTMMNANNGTGSDGQITTIITATVVPLVAVGVIVCIVVVIAVGCVIRRSRNICKESQQHYSAEHDISISTTKSYITYADRDVDLESTTVTYASEATSSDEERCNYSKPATSELSTKDIVPDGARVRHRQATSISLQNTS